MTCPSCGLTFRAVGFLLDHAQTCGRHVRRFSVVDNDAQEHAAALRDDPASYKRVGGSLVDVYDLPDPEDAA